jgi:hypothetical protein
MPKKIKGKISDKEGEYMRSQMSKMPMAESDDSYENYKGRLSERESEYLRNEMPSMPSTGGMGLEDESLKPGQEYRMKKGGMTKAQKKVGSVMKEFKAGKLHSGKKGPVVKNPKQAIAIALSESGQSKKKMMGGMMSDGISKKGMGVEKRMGGGMMSDGVTNKGSGIEMKSKGGMVRGQGAAIRGTKFKGIF